MIHDARKLQAHAVLHADVCVIGSGAGGSMAAWAAAQAGLRVVTLEAGGLLTPEDMTQREEVMMPQLYWDGAARSTADRGIHVHQGKGVGGSTLHNLNLCKRIDPQVREQWRQSRPMQALPEQTWAALYSEVEQLLSVSAVPQENWNRHNQLLRDGCDKLGWRWAGLSHNRSGCAQSGFCALGCAYDAKNNAAKIIWPRAVALGVEVLTHAQAVRIDHDGQQVRAVHAVAIDASDGHALQNFTVFAPRICVAASATATPALLIRSQVPDPSGQTGQHLRLHPAVVVAGEFDDRVAAWRGIPQTVECTEFLDFSNDSKENTAKPSRLWIVPAFAHPMGTATMLPQWGEAHRSWMKQYAHLGVLTAMIHERSDGRVQPDGDLGVRLDYQLTTQDHDELVRGLAVCAQIWFAAGAKRVLLGTQPALVMTHADDRAVLAQAAQQTLALTAVHPMASMPMSDNPQQGSVDSRGQHHGLRGLWIADGSLLPSSIGVPPQLSIYALGLHVGRQMVAVPAAAKP